MWVQCKKTGRWYDPLVEFRKFIESKEVKEIMVRLKNR